MTPEWYLPLADLPLAAPEGEPEPSDRGDGGEGNGERILPAATAD